MIVFNQLDNICVLDLEGENYRSIGIATVCLTNISPAARRFINCIKTWLCETQGSNSTLQGKGLGDVVDRNDVSITKEQELAGKGTTFVEIRRDLWGD